MIVCQDEIIFHGRKLNINITERHITHHEFVLFINSIAYKYFKYLQDAKPVYNSILKNPYHQDHFKDIKMLSMSGFKK